MPQESFYKAALADDDELAEMFDLDDNAESTVPLVGYSRLIQTVDDMRNEIRALRTDMVNTNPAVQRKSKFEPVHRPETALMRRQERERDERVSSIVNRVLPGG